MSETLDRWRRIRRIVRIGRLALHLARGAFVAHVVFSVIELFPRVRSERLRERLVRKWTLELCRVLNLRIVIDGDICAGPTLFVTNHVSWLDIPCLQATLNAAFISKREVLSWPVIGAMAARAGTIFLERGGRKTTAAAADQMTWRLASRRNVVMFPEGTTTDGTTLKPFHARLYQAAIRTHSRIQAVALRYSHGGAPSRTAPFINDDELLPHLWRLLGEDDTTVQLTLCKPVAPNLDRRMLAAITHTQIREALGLDAPVIHEKVLQIKANSRANLG